MRAPHRIEFDAHKRRVRLAHHLILQLARRPVCNHRWAGVSLGGVHSQTTASASGIASLQARTEGIPSHDSSGAGAWVALPDTIGPEDGIRRLRRGIRGPKVAAAFQAGPELIGLPGFARTRVREVHQRSATLAAHLKVDVIHSPDSITEPSPLCHPPTNYVGPPCRRFDMRVRWGGAALAPQLSRLEIAVSSWVRHSVSTEILTEP